jgi:hypothetical protein
MAGVSQTLYITSLVIPNTRIQTVSETRVLGRIFGPKGHEVSGWSKLRNEKLTIHSKQCRDQEYMDLYIYSPIRLHGVVLNQLGRRILYHLLFYLLPNTISIIKSGRQDWRELKHAWDEKCLYSVPKTLREETT